MAWTDLSAVFAYGTKLTATQMQNLRDNIAAAFGKESGAPVLANGYVVEDMLGTGAVTADKIGSGALSEDKIASSAVTQSKLKTSTGSVSTSSGADLTLPGGEYGFYPQLCASSAGAAIWGDSTHCAQGTTSGTYTTNIYLRSGSGTVYARQRYVTSSGEVFWVFILRDKATKEVLASWQSPDHPSFGNGGKPALVPHPFADVKWDEEKQCHMRGEQEVEIVTINPTHEEVAAMRAKCAVDDENKPDRDLLDVILNDYELDEDSAPDWPTKAVTVGLPTDYQAGEIVETVKKVVPQPTGVITKSLKVKTAQVKEVIQ